MAFTYMKKIAYTHQLSDPNDPLQGVTRLVIPNPKEVLEFELGRPLTMDEYQAHIKLMAGIDDSTPDYREIEDSEIPADRVLRNAWVHDSQTPIYEHGYKATQLMINLMGTTAWLASQESARKKMLLQDSSDDDAIQTACMAKLDYLNKQDVSALKSSKDSKAHSDAVQMVRSVLTDASVSKGMSNFLNRKASA